MNCQGRNRKGEHCQMPALKDGRWCWAHAPELARERAQTRRKAGQIRAGTYMSDSGEPPDAVRLDGPGDVLDVIRSAVAAELALPNSSKRNRTLGSLAGVALRALEVGELEGRLAALEERLANEARRRA